MKKETKDTIIWILIGIYAVSFFVMIWGLFIHLSIWGLIAMPVCVSSLVIALLLGLPEDNHGPFSGWKYDGAD